MKKKLVWIHYVVIWRQKAEEEASRTKALLNLSAQDLLQMIHYQQWI
jgi:hypothetical protein